MNWTILKLQQAKEAVLLTNGDLHNAAKMLRDKWHKTVTADDIIEAITEREPVFDLKTPDTTCPIPKEPEVAFNLNDTAVPVDGLRLQTATWQNYRPRATIEMPTPSPVAKVVVSAGVQRGIVIPDSHHPLVDKRANGVAIGIIKDCQPDFGVIIGDFGDLESLSKHPKSRPDLVRLSHEYYSMNLALDEIQNASPNTKWVYIEGNHERRAKKYSAEQGELDGMLNVPEQLFITPPGNGYFRSSNNLLRGMVWVPYEQQPFITPHSAYWHGHHYTSQHHASKNANTYANSRGKHKPVFYGHMHTFQHFTDASGTYAVCTGFLGNEKALGYVDEKPVPWVTGIVYQEVIGDMMTWMPIYINNGRAIFRGKLITSEG